MKSQFRPGHFAAPDESNWVPGKRLLEKFDRVDIGLEFSCGVVQVHLLLPVDSEC